MSEDKTTIQVKRRGGRRLGAGAPLGNSNARKGIPMPDGLKLESSDEVLRFMRVILIPSTLAGKIGTRQASAIITACKILLDYEPLEELEKRIEELEKAMQRSEGSQTN